MEMCAAGGGGEMGGDRNRKAVVVGIINWANPRGNAIRGRPVDGVEQAHSTRPVWKNTGNFIGPKLGTVAEITLQRTDTTHDLSSESREAIKRRCTKPNSPPHQHLPLPLAPSPTLLTTTSQTRHSSASPLPTRPSPTNPTHFSSLPNRFAAFRPPCPFHTITPHTLLITLFSGSNINTRSSRLLISCARSR
nr:hypothetical transcript [Hymenolepis microstoma]